MQIELDTAQPRCNKTHTTNEGNRRFFLHLFLADLEYCFTLRATLSLEAGGRQTAEHQALPDAIDARGRVDPNLYITSGGLEQ
jgi:hypothetical protein